MFSLKTLARKKLTSWVSYGVCLVSIVETIGHFVMELDCLDLIVWLLSWRHINWWTQLCYWMHICNTEHLRHCFNASCVCPYETYETDFSAFLGSMYNLMTLRYENSLHIIGPLWGNPPLWKRNGELWCFLCYYPVQAVEHILKLLVICYAMMITIMGNSNSSCCSVEVL